jgi:hypothetical protein
MQRARKLVSRHQAARMPIEHDARKSERKATTLFLHEKKIFFRTPPFLRCIKTCATENEIKTSLYFKTKSTPVLMKVVIMESPFQTKCLHQGWF